MIYKPIYKLEKADEAANKQDGTPIYFKPFHEKPIEIIGKLWHILHTTFFPFVSSSIWIMGPMAVLLK